MSITLTVNDAVTHLVTVGTFNDGSVSVCIPDMQYPPCSSSIVLEAQLQTSIDVISLLMTVDACRNKFRNLESISLVAYYMPYSRQDRICNKGEALSCKVFADLINGCGFKSVTMADPHSDVMPSLINNCQIIDVSSIISADKDLSLMLMKKQCMLVAPDMGARKKVEGVAKRFGHSEIIQGSKRRDLKTGVLTNFEYYGDVEGKNLLIVDDICDGGGTFVGLAKKLMDGGANKIDLYVTHGFFSRGFNAVCDGENISEVYTTNSIDQPDDTVKNVINLHKTHGERKIEWRF